MFKYEWKAYYLGYYDGYQPDRDYNNPFYELSPEWVEYETGYDAGLRRAQSDLRSFQTAL